MKKRGVVLSVIAATLLSVNMLEAVEKPTILESQKSVRTQEDYNFYVKKILELKLENEKLLSYTEEVSEFWQHPERFLSPRGRSDMAILPKTNMWFKIEGREESKELKDKVDSWRNKIQSNKVLISKLEEKRDKATNEPVSSNKNRAEIKIGNGFGISANAIIDHPTISGAKIASGNIEIKHTRSPNKSILTYSSPTKDATVELLPIANKTDYYKIVPKNFLTNNGVLYASSIQNLTAPGPRQIELAKMMKWEFDTNTPTNTQKGNLTVFGYNYLPIMQGINRVTPGIDVGYFAVGDGAIIPVKFEVSQNRIVLKSKVLMGVNFAKLLGIDLPLIVFPIDGDTVSLSHNASWTNAEIKKSIVDMVIAASSKELGFSNAKSLEGALAGTIGMVVDGVEGASMVLKESGPALKESISGILKAAPTEAKNFVKSQIFSQLLPADQTKFQALGIFSGLISLLGNNKFFHDPLNGVIGIEPYFDMGVIGLAGLGASAGSRFGFTAYYDKEKNMNTYLPNNLGAHFKHRSADIFMATAEPTVRATQAIMSSVGASVGVGVGLLGAGFYVDNLAPIFYMRNFSQFKLKSNLHIGLADSLEISRTLMRIPLVNMPLFSVDSTTEFDASNYAMLKFNGTLYLLNVELLKGWLEMKFGVPYADIGGVADVGTRIGLPGFAKGTLASKISTDSAAQSLKLSGTAKLNLQVPEFVPVIGRLSLGEVSGVLQGEFKSHHRDVKAIVDANFWWLKPRLTIQIDPIASNSQSGVVLSWRKRSLENGGRMLRTLVSDETSPLRISFGDTLYDGEFGVDKRRSLARSSETLNIPEDMDRFDIFINCEKSYPKFSVSDELNNNTYTFDNSALPMVDPKLKNSLESPTFAYKEDQKLSIFSMPDAKKGSYKVTLLEPQNYGACDIVASKANSKPMVEFKGEDSNPIEISDNKNISLSLVAYDKEDIVDVEFYLAKVEHKSIDDKSGHERFFDEYDSEDDEDVFDDGYFMLSEDDMDIDFALDEDLWEDEEDFGFYSMSDELDDDELLAFIDDEFENSDEIFYYGDEDSFFDEEDEELYGDFDNLYNLEDFDDEYLMDDEGYGDEDELDGGLDDGEILGDDEYAYDDEDDSIEFNEDDEYAYEDDYTSEDSNSSYVGDDEYALEDDSSLNDDEYGFAEDDYASDDELAYEDDGSLNDDEYAYGDENLDSGDYGYDDEYLYSEDDELAYDDEYAQDDDYYLNSRSAKNSPTHALKVPILKKLVPLKRTRSALKRTNPNFISAKSLKSGIDKRYLDNDTEISYENGILISLKDKIKTTTSQTTQNINIPINASIYESGEYRVFVKVDDGKNSPTYKTLGTPIIVKNPIAPEPPVILDVIDKSEGIEISWADGERYCDENPGACNRELRGKRAMLRSKIETIKDMSGKYLIQVFEKGAKKPLTEIIKDGKSSEFKALIPSLKMGSEYEIAVRAYGVNGTLSSPSEKKSITKARAYRSGDMGGFSDVTIVVQESSAKKSDEKISGSIRFFNKGDTTLNSAKVSLFYDSVGDKTKFSEFKLENIRSNGFKDIKFEVPSQAITNALNTDSGRLNRDPKIYYFIEEEAPYDLDRSNNNGSLNIEGAKIDEASGYNSYSYMIKNGWNLIGNPTTTSYTKMSSFDSDNILWAYRDSSWIQNPTEIEAGEGFWIKNSKEDYAFNIKGEAYELDFDKLSDGWSLVSSGVSKSNIAKSCSNCKVFSYINNQWQIDPSSVDAGIGFWVHK